MLMLFSNEGASMLERNSSNALGHHHARGSICTAAAFWPSGADQHSLIMLMRTLATSVVDGTLANLARTLASSF